MLATGKRHIKIDFPTPLEKKREARSVISFPSASLATGHWPLATLLSPLVISRSAIDAARQVGERKGPPTLWYVKRPDQGVKE